MPNMSECEHCLSSYVFMLLTLFTVPFYLLLVAVLLKYRTEFLSTFFTFFISTAVADIWLIFHKICFMTVPRLMNSKSVFENRFMSTIAKAGIWYIFYAQVFGVVLMTANRTSSLVLPGKHKQIWSKRVIKVLIALQWILPLPFGLGMLHPRGTSYYTKEYYPKFIDAEVHHIYFTIDMILEPGIIANSLVIMYVLMIYKLVRFRKKRVAPAKTQTKPQEKQETAPKTGAMLNGKKGKTTDPNSVRTAQVQLAFTGILISTTYLFICGSFIFMYMGIESPAVLFTFLYGSDIFTIINPWALLIFSAGVRGKILDLIFSCYSDDDEMTLFRPAGALKKENEGKDEAVKVIEQKC